MTGTPAGMHTGHGCPSTSFYRLLDHPVEATAGPGKEGQEPLRPPHGALGLGASLPISSCPSLCSSFRRPQFTLQTRPCQPALGHTAGPGLYSSCSKFTGKRNWLALPGSTLVRWALATGLDMTCTHREARAEGGGGRGPSHRRIEVTRGARHKTSHQVEIQYHVLLSDQCSWSSYSSGSNRSSSSECIVGIN